MAVRRASPYQPFLFSATPSSVATAPATAPRYTTTMRARELHGWNVSPAEAPALQTKLAALVVRQNAMSADVRHVAGVDLSPPDAHGVVAGAVVVLRYPELAVVEVRLGRGVPSMPYIPDLLSFRESPVLLKAFEMLCIVPDVVLVDGQGIAHPRRLGIASHLGVLLDVPMIGCAKSVLRGKFATPPDPQGTWSEMLDRGEVVGAALRTRNKGAPVYVSIGHKVDLPAAIDWTMRCCRGYRLPEPTRLAHLAAAGRIPETV